TRRGRLSSGYPSMVITGAILAEGQREQFLLAARDVVGQEAMKIAHHCRSLRRDDLYGEGMLYVVAQADRLLEGWYPLGLVRHAVHVHLQRYALERDPLIRKPLSHRPGER